MSEPDEPTGSPPPVVPPADAPAATPSAPPDTNGSAGSGAVPVWLVVLIVVVVLVVVGVALAVVLGGGDDTPDDTPDEATDEPSPGERPDAVPVQATTADASTPIINLLASTQWDLDNSVITSSFGNTCSYQGPTSFLGCTLIGGDANRRVDLPGVDLLNGSSLTPDGPDGTVEPVLTVAPGVGTLDSGDDPQCPGTLRMRGAEDPVGDGPAVCIRSTEGRVFAIYLTGVETNGALHLVAVEVAP